MSGDPPSDHTPVSQQSPDWSGLAVPGESGRDTEILLAMIERAEREGSISRVPPPEPGEQTLFGGRVAVRAEPRAAMTEPDFRLAPLDHPSLGRASALIARWPEVHEQVGSLLNVIVPLYYAAIRPAERATALGSSSFSDDLLFGVMLATVEDPLGLAQAIVQETARFKLRALGILSTHAHHLIVNPPGELAASPIRHDEPRPVAEVLHDVYSFIYVTALDLAMIGAEDDPGTLDRLLLLLARNTPRMQSGCAQLKEVVRTDRAGDEFMTGFWSWADDVLTRAESTLDRHGFGFPALAG